MSITPVGSGILSLDGGHAPPRCAADAATAADASTAAHASGVPGALPYGTSPGGCVNGDAARLRGRATVAALSLQPMRKSTDDARRLQRLSCHWVGAAAVCRRAALSLRAGRLRTLNAGGEMDRLLLVPLDGSSFAAQALPYATSMATALEARLELVVVRQQGTAIQGLHADGWLQRVVAQVDGAVPAGVRGHVLEDDRPPLDYPPPASNGIAHVVAAYAAERGAIFVVMATHGEGGLRRAWRGSVADSLVRIAPCPVLLVRPDDESFLAARHAERGFRHLLVPLDGTDTAAHALPYAVQAASPGESRITLLRVVSPLAWNDTDSAGEHHAGPLSRGAAADALERAAEPIRELGLTVSTDVRQGSSPADVILEFAEAEHADLIVIGTGAPGKVKRLLLGSVADAVARGSHVPVLVCRAPRHAEAQE
jgi:nucleotide-binding universal stress UspA family protein